MTDHSQWIGADARKLPDGSVAWVKYKKYDLYDMARLRAVRGGKLYFVDVDNIPMNEDPEPDSGTVIAIIKLGEERPKTFADVPAYEAWENQCGTLHWKDCDGAMCYLMENGLPEVNCPREPQRHPITLDMHRVGMVTGILVDGKPWPVKE